MVFALGYRPPRHPTLPGVLGRGGYNLGIRVFRVFRVFRVLGYKGIRVLEGIRV